MEWWNEHIQKKWNERNLWDISPLTLAPFHVPFSLAFFPLLLDFLSRLFVLLDFSSEKPQFDVIVHHSSLGSIRWIIIRTDKISLSTFNGMTFFFFFLSFSSALFSLFWSKMDYSQHSRSSFNLCAFDLITIIYNNYCFQWPSNNKRQQKPPR